MKTKNEKPEDETLVSLPDIFHRVSSFPLNDRLRTARRIIHNALDWQTPKIPKGGYVEFIDSDGDLICTYGDSNRERVSISGFNLIKPADPEDLQGINHHLALESNTGIIVNNCGAVYSVLFYDESRREMIRSREAHHLLWHSETNTIYGMLGARKFIVAELYPLDKDLELGIEKNSGASFEVIYKRNQKGEIVEKSRPRGRVLNIKNMGLVDIVLS